MNAASTIIGVMMIFLALIAAAMGDAFIPERHHEAVTYIASSGGLVMVLLGRLVAMEKASVARIRMLEHETWELRKKMLAVTQTQRKGRKS